MALVYLPASFLIISGFVSFFSYVFPTKFCFIAFLSRFRFVLSRLPSLPLLLFLFFIFCFSPWGGSSFSTRPVSRPLLPPLGEKMGVPDRRGCCAQVLRRGDELPGGCGVRLKGGHLISSYTWCWVLRVGFVVGVGVGFGVCGVLWFWV